MTQTIIESGQFGGLNNADGFHSFFGELTEGLSYLYVIKGGPGTGKSYFMKLLLREAEKNRLAAEPVYCSSDPDSLDGILLPAIGIGVFDGTAPHILDPLLPRVNGEWIRFDTFLDRNILQTHRNRLEELASRKNELYGRVKSESQIYAAADREITAYTKEALDFQKMDHAISRIIKKLGGKNGKRKTVQIASVGMRGLVRLSTLDSRADEIRPIYGHGADIFLSRLALTASEEKIRTVVSYHPIVPDQPSDLLFPDAKVLFTLRERTPSENGINMERFLNRVELKTRRSSLRLLHKIRSEALDAVNAAYSEIRNCHFTIENIYGEALNVKEKEEYSKGLINRILSAAKP